MLVYQRVVVIVKAPKGPMEFLTPASPLDLVAFAKGHWVEASQFAISAQPSHHWSTLGTQGTQALRTHKGYIGIY